MKDFPERLRRAVAALRRRDDVIVLGFHIAPPDPRDLGAVEREIGRAIPADVRRFYEACNGVELAWIHRKNPQFDPAVHVAADGPLEDPWYAMSDYRHDRDGLIVIPSARTLLLGLDAKELNDYLSEEGGPVAMIDWISFTSSVFLDLDDPKGVVLLANDHNISFDDVPATFASYLDLLVWSSGALAARRAAYCNYLVPRAVNDTHSMEQPLVTDAAFLAGRPAFDPGAYDPEDHHGYERALVRCLWGDAEEDADPSS